MPKLTVNYKGFLAAFLVVLMITAAFWFFDVRDLCAHTPHDPIDALAVSPHYAQDQTLFIVVSDSILRSRDGGFSWRESVSGLDNKQHLSSIVIATSHQPDQTLLVSSRGDGIYRSQDGGDSWTQVNHGLGTLDIHLLSMSPAFRSDRTALAAGAEGGLYKTVNGGDNWHQAMDEGTKVTAIAFSPDLSKRHLLIGDHRGMLHLSTDGGETWHQAFRFSNAGAITSIAISPVFSSDDTFFVGTDQGGIFRTADGGVSFIEVNEGLRFTIRGRYGTLRKSKEGPLVRRDEKTIISLAVSPNYAADSTVFATMWNEAVFKSVDGGTTWKKHPIGLTCDSQADSDRYKSPHFRDLAFAADGIIFLGAFDGLFKSTDGGRHWMQMETLPLSLVRGLALSPGDINSSSCAVTTYGGGTYITQDRGTTWAISNQGLTTTRIGDIVFSPDYDSDDTMFSASRGYLLKSTDRGNSWEKTALDYTTSWRTRISSGLGRLGVPALLTKQILSEAERQSPFATVLVLSPDFESDETIYFGTRWHGVFMSPDGGFSASAIWDGTGQPVSALVISPNFSSDGTLFAGVDGTGIYKTVDRGNTWQPANNGLTFLEVWQSLPKEQLAGKDILLAISPHYRADKTVFAASSEGLFKTTDGAITWQELKEPVFEDSFIVAMAMSPDYEKDETLIVSVRGRGLFKSENGGADFAEIGHDLIDNNHAIKYMVFSASYAADATIYVASDEELFRSTDGGNIWASIARPVRYENMRDVVLYEGEWVISKGDDFSASSVSHSSVAHDRAILNFVGTGISWIGTQASDQGIARIYIDGNHIGDVDQFGEARKYLVRSFSSVDLTYGPHTIAIEVTGMKNPQSTGYRVEIDAFDIVR